MTEGFEADPAEIAGLGKLAAQIGSQTLESARYINDHAGLSDTLQGQILQRLAPFITNYQEYTGTRHAHLAANCSYIGDELQKTAWLYDDQEKKNYDALNAHTDLLGPALNATGSSETPAVGLVQEYVYVADYGSPSGIDYPPPNPAIDDIRETIDEAAGWLGDVDQAIFDLTEWSPLNDATIPITGNWNEIRRLGQAFEIAGNAMESAAMSFDAGVRRVDYYWDGLAAQSFSEYANRQLDAMYWEGPCGRTVSGIAQAVAEKIREAVQTVIRKIVELLEAEVELDSSRGAIKFMVKKIPVLGTTWQIERVIEICWQAMDLTMELVRGIEELAEQFSGFLEALVDPHGQIKGAIEEHLEPMNEFLDKGKTAVDAGKTMDIGPVISTPQEKFSVGEGAAPWQDA